jgi:copper homeostasis protein
MTLEVCVDSVESAMAAQQGGAGRVELCADLAHGGTTPSAGMIKSVRDRISISLSVMIRPRPGEFTFSDDEFEIMKRDVAVVKDTGADGVVIGMLTQMGDIDVKKTRDLLGLARPMSVTCHRAIDECADLPQALENLKSLGVDRFLTSGGRGDIIKNIDVLAELVERAGPSLNVMAGGGITFENVKDIVCRSHVKDVHVLSAVSSMTFRNHLQSNRFGFSQWLVDESKVRAIVELLRGLSPDSQE